MFKTLAAAGMAATLTTAALTAGAALAADLPVRAAPVPAPLPVFTWTGFYGGLQTTYISTERQRIQTVGNDAFTQATLAAALRPGITSTKTDRFAHIGGGVGYNYQFTPGSGFVVGVAAHADWVDIRKNRLIVPAPAILTQSQFRQSLDYLGTVTGRVGYALDRFLVYGTGGLAFGDVDYRTNFYSPAPALTLLYSGRSRSTETGWAAGAGVEYALAPDSLLSQFSIGRLLGLNAGVTVKVEYLHYDLGTRAVAVAPVAGVGSYTSRFRTEGDLVRAGFNYKFNSL